MKKKKRKRTKSLLCAVRNVWLVIGVGMVPSWDLAGKKGNCQRPNNKFSINNVFSKYEQMSGFLLIFSYLLKKSSMEKSIFMFIDLWVTK